MGPRDPFVPCLKGSPDEVFGDTSGDWRATSTFGPELESVANWASIPVGSFSEVPKATVQTLVDTNKMIREVSRTSPQRIVFPAWRLPWQSICAMVWADASQGNRPNKSSTVGILGCLGPDKILENEGVSLAMISWRSSKCPRESLGSNGQRGSVDRHGGGSSVPSESHVVRTARRNHIPLRFVRQPVSVHQGRPRDGLERSTRCDDEKCFSIARTPVVRFNKR